MTDIAKVINGYIASWNETDPARCRELIETVFTEDATYARTSTRSYPGREPTASTR